MQSYVRHHVRHHVRRHVPDKSGQADTLSDTDHQASGAVVDEVGKWPLAKCRPIGTATASARTGFGAKLKRTDTTFPINRDKPTPRPQG